MLRAIIFDCDGVLADTEPMHCRAMDAALQPIGLSIGWERYQRDYLGMTDPDMFRKVLTEAHRPADEELVARLTADKARDYPALLARHVQPTPGVIELIRRVAARWPLAVCSGAFRADVDAVLAKLGDAAAHFRVIVSNEDVREGKPNPEGYLLAVERLGAAAGLQPRLQPRECIAIEDSIPGVAAARAAGLTVIRYVDRADAHMAGPRPEGIGLEVSHLASVQPADLEALVL